MNEKKPYKVGDKTIMDGYENKNNKGAALAEGQVVMLTDQEFELHQHHGVVLIPCPPAGNVADNDRHFAEQLNQMQSYGPGLEQAVSAGGAGSLNDPVGIQAAGDAAREEIIDHDEEGSDPDDPDEM